jgi:hypothetical protein
MGKGIVEFEKDYLKTILLSYGEVELANKVDALTDNEIKAIGQLSIKYIAQFSLVAQTLACGAVEFMEGTYRPLKRKKRDMKYYRSTGTTEKNIEEKEKSESLIGKLKRLMKLNN